MIQNNIDFEKALRIKKTYTFNPEHSDHDFFSDIEKTNTDKFINTYIENKLNWKD
jgi:hypothetical protein